VAQGRLAALTAIAIGEDLAERLESVALCNTYLSLLDCLRDPRRNQAPIQTTHGLLRHADMPQFMARLGDTPLTIANPYDENDNLHGVETLAIARPTFEKAVRSAGFTGSLEFVIEDPSHIYERLATTLFPG
jgi:hypothetical protein